MSTLRVCALYPDLMNIYADRGNLLVLERRCAWRGLGFELTPVGLGEPLDGSAHDLFYLGGGQDRDQRLCAEDLLATKREALHAAAARGAVVLGVCGGYQLLGRSYELGPGEELPGVGLLDVRTVREDGPRLIGNVAIEVSLDGGGEPRPCGLRESRRAHSPRRGPGSARARPEGLWQRRAQRLRGCAFWQRDWHLSAWAAAAEEHLVCGLADRHRAGDRPRASFRRSMMRWRTRLTAARAVLPGSEIR